MTTLTTLLYFLLRTGLSWLLALLLALKGVQGEASKSVLFKSVTAHEEDYQAYLLRHPKTLSFVDYFQKQRAPLQSELLELLSLARQKDLQTQTQEAKQLYVQVMDLFFTGGHWSQRTLSLFLFVAGRLYQLEKNKAPWKRFLQKMLHLHPQWKDQFQHKDFESLYAQVPQEPRTQSWQEHNTQNQREQKAQQRQQTDTQKTGLMAFLWDFSKQFPLAEKIIVNGLPFSPHSKEPLSLLPGFYQFTLLSNTFHPIQAFLHTEDLPSWKPHWIPFLKGSCTRPNFHYPFLKIHPQKNLWFFHLACVRSLAQTTHLSPHYLNPHYLSPHLQNPPPFPLHGIYPPDKTSPFL